VRSATHEIDFDADIYQGGGHCMAEGGTRSKLAGEAEKTSKVKRSTSRAKAVARKARGKA
jgi:hypothetical protein